MNKLLSVDSHNELMALDPNYKELFVLNAFNSFWHFCLYMDYDFYYSRRKVLEDISYSMQCLIFPLKPEDEIDILNVSLPPRTGKSYLCTLFCAWCLGHFPDESIMRNTVTAKLYQKFSRDLISMIKSETHRGRIKDVFNLELKTENVADGWTLKTAKQGVSYFGAGVGGSIIGFGATLLSIIDDSVKDEWDALSPLQMDKKWSWYTSAVDSREEKGCKKLFIGTRWSKTDIVGRLTELNFFDRESSFDITIPALSKDDVSFCEEVHTTKKLVDKRKITSDIIWEAEWMQSPIEAKGLLYPRDELNFFDIDKVIQKRPDGVVIVGDIADEGADSLCVPVGYLFGEKVYIVDVLFTTDKVELTEPQTADLIDKYRPDQILFESNNGGKGFARAVEELIKHPKKIRWKHTSKNKETRIIMKSRIITENFYFRNDDKISKEYMAFMKELTSYSKMGKNKHDDAPDGITMLAELVTNDNTWGW